LNVSEAGLPGSGSSYLYTQPGSPVVGLLSQIISNGGTTQLSYYHSGATNGLLSNLTRPDLSSTDYVWIIGLGTQLTQVTGSSATAMAWDTMQNLASVTPPTATLMGRATMHTICSIRTQPQVTPRSICPQQRIPASRPPDCLGAATGPEPHQLCIYQRTPKLPLSRCSAASVGNTAMDWELRCDGVSQGHVATITGPGAATSTAVPLSFASSVPKVTYTYNGYLPITRAGQAGYRIHSIRLR